MSHSEHKRRPVVVHKYGGSSVADAGRLKQVARRVVDVARQGYGVVVVISAMGQTTDELVGLSHEVSSAPARRELDMLLSAGERIASSLLAMAVSELGHPAISFTGSQCGIITNDRHTDARILEVRPYRVEDELDRGYVVIIAGFQGVSYKREITTLGRGGSDTTAVAMAAALGAEHCEICSDVDGVYTADPRLVAEARHLPQISYDEMLELSQHGAQVLNAEAVAFARRNRILIRARATAGEAGRVTEVGPDAPHRPAVGVTGLSSLIALRADGAGQTLAALTRTCGRFGVAPLWARLHSGRVLVVLDQATATDSAALMAAVRDEAESLHIESGLEAASVIGRGFTDAARLDELFALVERQALEPVDVDVTPTRATLLLRPGSLDRAVGALHEHFIERDL